MINKVVIFLPRDNQDVVFNKPKHYYVGDNGVIYIITQDNFKYVSNCPFMVEEDKKYD